MIEQRSKYPEIEQHIAPELLAANCHHTKKAEQPRYFSDEEAAGLKEELFKYQSIVENRTEMAQAARGIIESSGNPLDELQQLIVRAENEKVYLGDNPKKVAKETSKSIVQRLNKGFELEHAETYAFDYPEIKRMAYFDGQGNYIYDRPMEAGEQTALLATLRTANAAKTGTHE